MKKPNSERFQGGMVKNEHTQVSGTRGHSKPGPSTTHAGPPPPPKPQTKK